MAATTERPGRWYTNRADARRSPEIDSSNTSKDALIDMRIVQASRFIETYTNRRFIPWTGTKTFDWSGGGQLFFEDDLISITTISDDSATIAASDYFLYPLNNLDDNKPYLWLEMLRTDDSLAFDDTRQSAISITGKWGYSELLHSETTLDGAHNASTTTLNVQDGANIGIGTTLLVNSEQIFVVDTESIEAPDVSRGMNGTTAASHSDSDTVYIIEPEPSIKLATEILVARLINRGDASWADAIGGAGAELVFAKALPAEVRDILNRYKRHARSPIRLVGRSGSAGRWRWPTN